MLTASEQKSVMDEVKKVLAIDRALRGRRDKHNISNATYLRGRQKLLDRLQDLLKEIG